MKKSLVLTLLILISFSCAPKETAVRETREAHELAYLKGMEQVELGDLEEASKFFAESSKNRSDYALALAGKALVNSLTTNSSNETTPLLKEALSSAKDDSERFSIYTTCVRVYTNLKTKDWLKEAEKCYQSAKGLKEVKEKKMPYYRSKLAANYFMARAYYEAGKFREAKNLLRENLRSPYNKWHLPAKTLASKIEVIEKLLSEYQLKEGTKRYLTKESLSKDEVFEILSNEVPASKVKKISEVLREWKKRLKGPEVTRIEFAKLVEDILVKLTGDERLKYKYAFLDLSPFPDLTPTSPEFNPAMVAVEGGYLFKDSSNAFLPDEPVTALDVILFAKRLFAVGNPVKRQTK